MHPSMEEPKEQQQHIVLFPYMAQGHLIPFLALAKLLEQRHPTLTITLLSTPLNIQTLRRSHPTSSAILLRALPFRSSDHNLPPDSESTDTLPLHHILGLCQASESLLPHFELFVSQHHPTCIIADVFLGWTVDVAKKLGISHATFTTCGALGTAAYFSLWLNLPHTQTTSEFFDVPGFPPTFKLHRTQLSSYLRVANGADPWSLFLRKQIALSLRSSDMLCNTVDGLESDLGLRLLREITGLPVWSIGPLLPLETNSSAGRVGKKSGIDSETLMAWLDSHAANSVLYVSFGSQSTIGAAQMMALAKGLEASGAAFIWVIRPPAGYDVAAGEEVKVEWLPEGLEERMKERKRGVLVRGWAPQLEILSHGSTGGFLSHCGWNSTLESLSRGVPVIAWPLASDQFYNSILLAELGVGVEMARGVMGEVEEEKVARVVEVVMGAGDGGQGKGKGKEMREKAKACGEMIREAMRDSGEEVERMGSSIKAIDEFIAKMVESKIPY